MSLFDQHWRLYTGDFSSVSPAALNDPASLEGLLARCLGAGDLVVTRWVHHRFEPQGVSLLGHGPRVRVVLHTWPEHEAATLDLWLHGEGGQRILESCIAQLPHAARAKASMRADTSSVAGE